MRVTSIKFGEDLDPRTVLIFGTALVSLWIGRFGIDLIPDQSSPLAQMCWWSGTQIFCYLVIPFVVIHFLDMRPIDIGWKFRGMARHWKMYTGLFTMAIPFVVAASYTAEFQERYPLLQIVRGQIGVWHDLRIWWIFYIWQFIAVETFFRGFLVLGLAKRFGQSSILMAMIPYLMIHFSKPSAEALAAIIGGLVMGILAYRTKSIWWGIGLHVCVAVLMDILSLGHKGFIW